MTPGRVPGSIQLVSLKDLQTDANDRDVMSGVQAHDRRALEKLYATLSDNHPIFRIGRVFSD
jgi:hypothetical protein